MILIEPSQSVVVLASDPSLILQNQNRAILQITKNKLIEQH